MSTKTLIVQGEGYRVSLSPEATKIRDESIAKALSIIVVETEEQQNQALLIAGGLKGLVKDCESSRESIKRPILDVGRLIDGTANTFKKPLEAEIKRIEALCGTFQAEQRKKAFEAEQARLRAIREQQLEQDRLLRLEQEKAEQERLAAEAKSKKAREAAAAQARKLSEEIHETEASIFDHAETIADSTPQIVEAANAAVREKFEIEITSPEALFAAFPEAVELKVKLAVLNDIVYRRGERNIPGVKLTPIVAVTSRSVSPQLSLQ